MNGSTEIPTSQANIEWYLKKNNEGAILFMRCKEPEDKTLRLLLCRVEEPSVLVFTKHKVQSDILNGWEQRFKEKLRHVLQNDKWKSHLGRSLSCSEHFFNLNQ